MDIDFSFCADIFDIYQKISRIGDKFWFMGEKIVAICVLHLLLHFYTEKFHFIVRFLPKFENENFTKLLDFLDTYFAKILE